MALGGVDNPEQQQSVAQRAREGTSKGLARQEVLSVEPWGGRATFRATREPGDTFPSPLPASGRKTCRHVASTSGSGPRGVSGCCSGRKAREGDDSSPHPIQAFKCEMSSETGEMSDRPKQNRWQNWQLGDRLPGRSSNFEVMLQAKEAGRPETARAKTQSGPTPLCGAYSSLSCETGRTSLASKGCEEQRSGKRW